MDTSLPGIMARTKALREEWFGLRGQAKMAKLLGLTPSGYNYFEVKAPLSSPLILRLAEKRKINPAWLLLGIGPKYFNRIATDIIKEESAEYAVSLHSFILPILSNEVAAGPIRAVEDYPAEDFITLYEKWLKHPKNTFVLKMKGDSMEPAIPDGSLVVVDTLAQEPVDGMIFAIRAEDNCVLRRLSLQKGALHFLPEHLSSTNRPFHFNKQAENPIIGKAIWVLNKLKKSDLKKGEKGL